MVPPSSGLKCAGVRIQSMSHYKGCMKGSHSTNGRRTDGTQLRPTGTVGEKKALFRVTVDKKWDDSPFKDLEFTSQEETRNVRKHSLSQPMWTEKWGKKERLFKFHKPD